MRAASSWRVAAGALTAPACLMLAMAHVPVTAHAQETGVRRADVSSINLATPVRPDADRPRGPTSRLVTQTDKPRGVVVARHAATLTTSLAVPVIRIGFREAETFAAGDELIAFDCTRQRAELAAAQAQVSEAQLTLRNARYLQSRKATGRFDVQVARARFAKAKADQDVIAAVIARCVVHAPFAGAVSELGVRVHETPRGDQPVMSIVATGALEIQLIVPSRWLLWLRPGATFGFDVDETGRVVTGRVARIGRVIDAVSQTVKLYADVASDDGDLTVGMSGTASFHSAAKGAQR
ncbi:MAG: efflux RND transporter periplasmic adaptor subunit [Pseudomonadota bacterium]